MRNSELVRGLSGNSHLVLQQSQFHLGICTTPVRVPQAAVSSGTKAYSTVMVKSCSCFAACFPTVSRTAPMEPQRNEEGESSEVASAVDIVAETPQKPRQQPAWVEGLRHSSMDPSDDCRYYCPLCMMYFECVYETKCCGHTV